MNRFEIVRVAAKRADANSQTVSRPLSCASLFLGCAAILLFQTGAYKHILALQFGAIAAGTYYSFWALCALTTLAYVIWRPSAVVRLAPLYAALVAIILLTLSYPPIGVASRSMIVSCSMIIVMVTILPLSDACASVMQVSAAFVALASISLVVEMFFPGTLSAISGRSASLYVNPNVAGSAVVLGGMATAPFIARNWRGAFAVLILSGVIATISRTSLIVLIGVSALAMAIERLKRGKKNHINKPSAIRTMAAATVCAVIFTIALQTSPPVAASFQTAIATALTAESSLLKARSDARLDEDRTVTALKLSELLGKVDSGAARLVLMKNALAETSRWGTGADRAHALAPHNQYLFFAVAFGVMGIVVVVLMIGAIGYLGRANLAFVLATGGVLMFTHDLTMLDLAVPIALGCAGAIYLDVNRRSPVI